MNHFCFFILLQFKELMLSIDQEEKIDENKPNNAGAGGSKTGTSDTSKLAILQQKLFEGIERTTTSKNSNGQDSTQATPRSKAKSKSAKGSSKKGTPGGSRSATKRKRKNDSDFSSVSESNSDIDDDDY